MCGGGDAKVGANMAQVQRESAPLRLHELLP
jgi:hypothetical protein